MLRRRRLRILSIAPIIFFAFALALAQNEQPRYGGTIVVAIGADPAGLNPAITTQGGVHQITASIFSGLVAHDFKLDPVPDLATRWEISPDGLRYTFHLTPNAKFHDGMPLTSADVKFTFEELLLKFHSRTRTSLGNKLQTILTPDPHTVVFKFNQPYAAFLQLIDVTNAPVMPKHLYGNTDPLTNPYNVNPVGSGVFIFEGWMEGDLNSTTKCNLRLGDYRASCDSISALLNDQVKEALVINYTQLTRKQRYQIYALQKAGHNQTEMASIIGVHKSTVSRELSRNRGQRGYRPKQAQMSAGVRKHQQTRAAATRIDAATWLQVESLLRQDWSPAKVSGHLKRELKLSLSHERIYQHIYTDKAAGGELHHHLRCQKKRRKRYGSYDRRGRIPQRVSIEERPQIVETRGRIGDWEADTIIGQNHHHALVCLVERKSKLTLLKKMERNTAEAVEQAISQLLHPLAAQVHSITSDNGREFSNHQAIATQLQAHFYFAHPYASWERGTNENTNGLVRQYFPKKSDFSKIDDAELERVMERLNTRPRKTLGFRTPNQVFFKHQSVALRC